MGDSGDNENGDTAGYNGNNQDGREEDWGSVGRPPNTEVSREDWGTTGRASEPSTETAD